MRDLRNDEIVALRPGAKAQMPPRGQLCLGRPFNEDPDGAYTVAFEGS
jgi:hypothetical protein